MCRVPVQLRELVKQRLAEAAEEIFALVEKTIGEYEEETERQRALLEQLLQTQVQLGSSDGGIETQESGESPCEPRPVKEERDTVDTQICSDLKTEAMWKTNPSPRQTHTGVSVQESDESSGTAVKTEREEMWTSSPHPTQIHPLPHHTQTPSIPANTQTPPPPPPPPHIQTLPVSAAGASVSPYTQNVPPPRPLSQRLPRLQAQTAQDVWTEPLTLNPLVQTLEPPQPWPCPGPSAAAAPVFPPGGAVHRNPSNPKTQKPEKRFRCTLCPKAFASNFHLVSHMRVHTGERPFQCPVCEKGFRVKGNLDQHMMIHYELRPFSCTFCGKSFCQKSNLNNHMLIHSGLKPFSCSVCGKRYRQKSSLSIHMATH